MNKIIVKYETTYYYDWTSGHMPIITKEFDNEEEAKVYINDPENEVYNILEIFEGKNRKDLINDLNKFSTKTKGS